MATLLDVKDVSENKIDKDKDIVIAVLGPTGSGKSHLIDTLTRQPNNRAGTRLQSVTQGVQAVRLRRRLENGEVQQVVLVDTPGFDDTNRSDMQILELIATWLKKTYEKNIKLSGIVYMHRITDNRVAGSPNRSLRVFKDLCGDHAASRVVFATTMWGSLHGVGLNIAESREEELNETFWKPMLDLGSQSRRFMNTEESAWALIEPFLKQTGKETQIQTEMVDKRRKVKETKAGMTLLRGLEVVMKEHTEQLGKMQARAAKTPNPEPEVYARIEAAQQKIATLDKDIQELKIPFSQKLLRFFTCGIL